MQFILLVFSLTHSLDRLHHFLYLSTIVLTPYSSAGPGALFRTSLCPRCVMDPRATPPLSAKAWDERTPRYGQSMAEGDVPRSAVENLDNYCRRLSEHRSLTWISS